MTEPFANCPPPLWHGLTVAVLGNGPSLTPAVLDELQFAELPAIAVSTAFQVAPWADVLFAHDRAWWSAYPAAAGFNGLRLTGQEDSPGAAYLVPVARELVVLREGHSVDLQNSGLAAIRLAASWGASRVVLAGFDFGVGHWHPDHPAPLLVESPDPAAVHEAALLGVIRDLAGQGCQVSHFRAPGPASEPLEDL